MNISAYSGATSVQSLTQKILSQLQSNSATIASEDEATADAQPTTATEVEEQPGFFQSNLSSDMVSSLLQGLQGGPPPGGGSGGFQPPSMDDMDSDGDGSLTQTELESWDASVNGNGDTSKAAELFSRMDTDGDGSVTSDEKSAFDDQMASQGPGRGPAPAQAQGQASDEQGVSSENLAALMQELMTALESYSSTASATTSASTTLLSVAA